jgi:glycosyltransferase involved in cell wall biosynthesis
LAAIAQYAWAARCLDRMPPGALRIIDTIDVQYNRAEQARDAGGDLSHIVCTREEEIRELRRAEALIAIQSKEALELKAMCPDRRVLTATHAQATRAAGSPAESRELLYTGNLYDPNVRGLETFLAQCWPSILVGIPGARLTVCGRVCEAFHDSYQGVRFEGFVQDLEPHYDRAAVVVNPIPYGTGLKIKTVDALSRGKALVATEPGVLGIPFDGDPPCRVSAMEGFTENILELMTSIPERRRLESAAVEYARRHFSADHVYRELTELLREHERTTQTTPPSAAAPKSTATQGADR